MMSLFVSMKILVVSGYSNSVKTSVAELLLTTWQRMGLKTATIKNVHTPKFQMDEPNTDSSRHGTREGSCQVEAVPKSLSQEETDCHSDDGLRVRWDRRRIFRGLD